MATALREGWEERELANVRCTRLILSLTASFSISLVISGPFVVLPFRVISTGPVVWLSNGISKYEIGLWPWVLNVIIWDSPIETVTEAGPLVTAMTEMTSLAPCAAETEPPWPHTAPRTYLNSALRQEIELELTAILMKSSWRGAIPSNGSIFFRPTDIGRT
jgi:hypothetical protein